MLPRKSAIETIDCLLDDLDLVDIGRIKNPSLKVSRECKTRQWFMPLRQLADFK